MLKGHSIESYLVGRIATPKTNANPLQITGIKANSLPVGSYFVGNATNSEAIPSQLQIIVAKAMEVLERNGVLNVKFEKATGAFSFYDMQGVTHTTSFDINFTIKRIAQDRGIVFKEEREEFAPTYGCSRQWKYTCFPTFKG